MFRNRISSANPRPFIKSSRNDDLPISLPLPFLYLVRRASSFAPTQLTQLSKPFRDRNPSAHQPAPPLHSPSIQPTHHHGHHHSQRSSVWLTRCTAQDSPSRSATEIRPRNSPLLLQPNLRRLRIREPLSIPPFELQHHPLRFLTRRRWVL